MKAVGCLCIGDLTVGKQVFSGPFPVHGLGGVALKPFVPAAGEDLWPGLQAALQDVRAEYGSACVLAAGAGCAAALALSVQLPVERLALLYPRRPCGPLRRLDRFARRNLALCVSDVLVVSEGESAYASALLAGGLGAHSPVIRLCIDQNAGSEMFTNPENGLNTALSRFLRTGELPKSLAENPEMCIIYG